MWRRCSVCFFFSSRRRHTRLVSDWSSDVCSSDLKAKKAVRGSKVRIEIECALEFVDRLVASPPCKGHVGEREMRPGIAIVERSEERRVGKECRSRWAGEH